MKFKWAALFVKSNRDTTRKLIQYLLSTPYQTEIQGPSYNITFLLRQYEVKYKVDKTKSKTRHRKSSGTWKYIWNRWSKYINDEIINKNTWNKLIKWLTDDMVLNLAELPAQIYEQIYQHKYINRSTSTNILTDLPTQSLTSREHQTNSISSTVEDLNISCI